MNIPSMTYYNYFVTIFHTEISTNLQTTFQNKKFCKIHRKIPILESVFNKVARLKRLHNKRFPRNFVKFSRTPYNEALYTT